MLGALLAVCSSIIMPVFTYKTMIIPEIGLPDNGLRYGSGSDTNRMAQFFQPDMPADRLMGIVPETLRKSQQARRSSHPILSFAGINAAQIIDAQSIEEPLAPIRILSELNGWVLLLGVDHTVNTSIHYAERLAARKQFVRWALTPKGITQCPCFPGCSEGFQAISLHLENVTRSVEVGKGKIIAVPLEQLVPTVVSCLKSDPLALLCSRPGCERCDAVRAAVAAG